MAEDRRDDGGRPHTDRANGSERDRKRSREDRGGEARPPPEHRVHHDAACVQSRDLAFGINYAASGGPEDRWAPADTLRLTPRHPLPPTAGSRQHALKPGLLALL